jgi:hypothetical protein
LIKTKNKKEKKKKKQFRKENRQHQISHPTWRGKELEGATASFNLKIERLRDEDLIERLNKREWVGCGTH